MPSTNALRATIHQLTQTFATSIVAALRASNLADILSLSEEARPAPRAPGDRARARGPSAKKPGRAKRTSAKRGAETGGGEAVKASDGPHIGNGSSPRDVILAHFRTHPGDTGEAARKKIGMARGQWSYTIGALMETGALRREGEKRATKYWAVG
jgi:hypothetical protein